MKNKIITISIISLLILVIINIGCIEEENDKIESESIENHPPTIQLTYPTNLNYTISRTHIEIEWNATDPDGDDLNITIYYKERREWKLIAENVTNDGEHIWNVGLTGMNTSIKITANDGEYWAEDMSEAFYIFNFPKDSPDYIEIISPNGGENWSGVQNITWKMDFIGWSGIEITLLNANMDIEYIIKNYSELENYTIESEEYLCYQLINTTNYENGNRYWIHIYATGTAKDTSDYFSIYNEDKGTRYNKS